MLVAGIEFDGLCVEFVCENPLIRMTAETIGPRTACGYLKRNGSERRKMRSSDVGRTLRRE